MSFTNSQRFNNNNKKYLIEFFQWQLKGKEAVEKTVACFTKSHICIPKMHFKN